MIQWYRQNARRLPWRETTDPYRIWVSEIMLQQTRVEAAISYYNRFLEALPDISALAAVPEERLHKLWEGLGYYARARNLQKAAQVVVREYGGKLPSGYSQLLALPGIGNYTAGAISSIAFGLPHPAVDGNVLRVLSRFLGWRKDIANPKTKTAMEHMLEKAIPVDAPGDFTQALMELGALVCTPTAPQCAKCPLQTECTANQLELQSELPVKQPKAKRTIVNKTVLVLVHNDCIALQKRPATGLLASMWELPSLDGHVGIAEVQAVLQQADCDIPLLTKLKSSKHIFTHVEWHMNGYLATVENPSCFTWASPAELQTQYAVPSSFRAFLAAFHKFLEQK